MTALEREMGRHRVDLLLLTPAGDIAESHRMQSWEVSTLARDLAGAYRDAHGRAPILRVRWIATPTRDGSYLLPRDWR